MEEILAGELDEDASALRRGLELWSAGAEARRVRVCPAHYVPPTARWYSTDGASLVSLA